MKIEAAELRVIHLDLLRPFETSFGVETARTVPVLRLFSNGLEGVSEGVMDNLPLFREETVVGALALLKDALLPRVLGIDLANPQDLVDRLAPFRGNRMAKAMLEMALWDLWACSLNIPLGRLLGGTRSEIPVGVSLGIQPTLEATREQVEKHLAQGYRRIKLKIKPGWDVNLVAYIRTLFPAAVLTVDANSCYTPADFGVMRALDQFGLDYIEQPLAYDDIFDHIRVDPLTRGCAQGTPGWSGARDQHQGCSCRRSSGSPPHSRCGNGIWRPSLVWGNARKRYRTRSQHPSRHAAQLQ
jgi:O-succinylbenzoate synthase